MINKYYSGWKANSRVRILKPEELTGAELLAKHLNPYMRVMQVPGSSQFLLSSFRGNGRANLFQVEMRGKRRKKLGRNLNLEQIMQRIEIIWNRG